MSDDRGQTFQMLWDCPYCGAEKLLGLSHRHCPGCGAPQDPGRRYFPAEADKIAVENHRYTGADLRCSSCHSPNSALAVHCVNCGQPLAGEPEVARVADAASGAHAGPAAGAQAAPPGASQGPPRSGTAAISTLAATRAAATPRRRWWLGCLLLLLAPLVLLLLNALWKKPAALAVAGHSWQRDIDIEALTPGREVAWCDDLPAGAYEVSRQREVRSHRQVPDGEDCSVRRVDQGDGTFREVRDCQPRYRDEPVHDDRCRFKIDRWIVARTATASGLGLSPAPAWPAATIARPGATVGSEREGKRRERYVVQLADPDRGQLHECSFDLGRWQAFELGSRWTGRVGAISGALDCDSLSGLER